MKFSSEFSQKHKILFGIVAVIIVASTIPVFFDENMKENWTAKNIILVVNLLSLGLLFWIITKTHYTINQNQLVCKSGPFKKTITIQSIKRIELHSGIIVPALWKLALSDKGIIIHHGQFDEIYISPKNYDKFISELLKINPNILLPTNA